MDKLHNWVARRAGAAITITHSTGKVTGVLGILPEAVPNGRTGETRRTRIVAQTAERGYELVISA